MEAQRNRDDAISLAAPASLELAEVPPPDAQALTMAKDSDHFLVTFDTPFDAENPQDWPSSRKWTVTDVLSATGFTRIMVSTIMAPALPAIASELNMNATEAAMSLSVYLLATVFGPMIIGPLSEVYGRRVILHGSSIWFLGFNVACGFARTKQTLIAARFLAGFGASAIYSLAGGVLGDIWRPEQRGRSLGVYLLIPLLAVAIGPIIGGFIAARTTWRWMFWSTSIFQTIMVVMSIFSFQETHGPVILLQRAKRLRQGTGDNRYHTRTETRHGGTSTVHLLKRALTRPIRLLCFHPIVLVSAILSGFDYGLLYVVLSTYSSLWTTQYGQSVEISGLHYLACSFGELVGSQVGGPLLDFFYKRSPTQPPLPESRIPLMFPGVLLARLGMIMYGWTAAYHAPWIVVDVGVFIMMFGMQISGFPSESLFRTLLTLDMSTDFIGVMAYVIDTYGEHTSSAMAAVQFMKSLTAFLFPLFAPSMYQALGYGWSNSIMALGGLVISVPLPIFLWKFGRRLRERAASTH